MRPSARIVACVALACFTAGGCGGTRYYRITDPTTSRVYYGERPDLFPDHREGSIKYVGGGAIRFTDLVTGDIVSIQSSERWGISTGQNPAATPATRPRE